jgi:integrase
MKMRDAHYVPLALQAVVILREIQPLTGSGRFIFPSLRTNTRPISEGTLNAAIRRIGFSKEEMTGHGFRTMASTLLNEQGWHPDLIELQLAHAERNKVRAAYNRAQRLDERRKMMQAYADYLDGLKTGAKVVLIRKAG